MITLQELTMGRDKTFKDEFTREVRSNLNVLLEKMNIIRKSYGKPMQVTSGWRPMKLNGGITGAAIHSKHIKGLACDIYDPDCDIWRWCLKNLELLQDLGIYLEDKRHTKNWVHFQIGPPASGKRIYKPNGSKYPNPELWDGKYDTNTFDKQNRS